MKGPTAWPQQRHHLRAARGGRYVPVEVKRRMDDWTVLKAHGTNRELHSGRKSQCGAFAQEQRRVYVGTVEGRAREPGQPSANMIRFRRRLTRVASVRPLLQGHHFQHRERFLSSSAFFSSKKRRVGVGSHFRCFGGSTSRTPARSPASTWLLGPKALRTKSRGSALIPGQALGVEVPDGEEPGLMAVGTQAPRGENKCQLRCLGININLRFLQTKSKP